MEGAPSFEGTGNIAGKSIVDGNPKSRDATESDDRVGGGSREQLAKRKVIRNDPHPSAETLLNRYHFDEGLRRGLLLAANNNSPLPEWLLRRKSYDRAGEFYVRLRAELVDPGKRDQAKIKRMLEELRSSQQQDANQRDGADDAMPGQDVGYVEDAGAEDSDAVPVEQSTKLEHHQLMGDGKHTQPSTQLNPNTRKYHEPMRRGLLKAAENGTFLSGWIQDRGAVGLGDFWVRLKEELLSKKRDQAKIQLMLDELKASELQGAKAAHDELILAEAELEEAEAESPALQRHPGNNEAEVKLKGQPDMVVNDDSDDVFVRWPRRRQRQLTRHQDEGEL